MVDRVLDRVLDTVVLIGASLLCTEHQSDAACRLAASVGADAGALVGPFASRTREEPSRSDASADPASTLDGRLRRRRPDYCASLLSGRTGSRVAVSPPTGSRCPGVSAMASVRIEREALARTVPDPQSRLACRFQRCSVA